MVVRIKEADRIRVLPPYLFAAIDRKKRAAIRMGKDIIDLGIGDPDRPTPRHIIKKLAEASRNQFTHSYPSYAGMIDFRREVANWYRKRFKITLNPETEVITLIGSKEGIAHFPFAFINPGDVALVPDPAYPVYKTCTNFAGGRSVLMPLLRENGFLPDLSNINRRIGNKAKIMFINYPNNPTAAVATKEFFKEVVRFAEKNNIIVCHDLAYSEMSYDGHKPPSIFQIKGAKRVAIEFHSLSKTYNMTGWRIGFAVGNKELIAGLKKIKTNVDSGVFRAVQFAGIEALRSPYSIVKKNVEVYKKRRDIFVNGLRKAGWDLDKPKATFYVWIPVPKGYSSIKFSSLLLDKAGIVATPGVGFGKYGEGYFRVSLTVSESRLREAVRRMKKMGY